jgi:hypothetical protein
MCLSVSLINRHGEQTYGEVEVEIEISLPRQEMKMSGRVHDPAFLTPGKEPRYPLGRRLGGRQSRSGR